MDMLYSLGTIAVVILMAMYSSLLDQGEYLVTSYHTHRHISIIYRYTRDSMNTTENKAAQPSRTRCNLSVTIGLYVSRNIGCLGTENIRASSNRSAVENLNRVNQTTSNRFGWFDILQNTQTWWPIKLLTKSIFCQ